MTDKLQLNQFVEWKECQSSTVFDITRVRGLSPCDRFALIDWIVHPVLITDLKPVEPSGLSTRYPNWQFNHWGENGIDLSTGRNLDNWVRDWEYREEVRRIILSSPTPCPV